MRIKIYIMAIAFSFSSIANAEPITMAITAAQTLMSIYDLFKKGKSTVDAADPTGTLTQKINFANEIFGISKELDDSFSKLTGDDKLKYCKNIYRLEAKFKDYENSYNSITNLSESSDPRSAIQNFDDFYKTAKNIQNSKSVCEEFLNNELQNTENGEFINEEKAKAKILADNEVLLKKLNDDAFLKQGLSQGIDTKIKIQSLATESAMLDGISKINQENEKTKLSEIKSEIELKERRAKLEIFPGSLYR